MSQVGPEGDSSPMHTSLHSHQLIVQRTWVVVFKGLAILLDIYLLVSLVCLTHLSMTYIQHLLQNMHVWFHCVLFCFYWICVNYLPTSTRAASLAQQSQIARFMGPTWGPSGANRTQVGPMLAPWTLLSGITCTSTSWPNFTTPPPMPLVAECKPPEAYGSRWFHRT